MQTENIVQLFPNKTSNDKMNLKDADALLSLITTITRKTKQEINVINSQAAYFKGQAIKTAELQNKVNNVIQKWSDKINKLGVSPVAMFKVKFDLQEGTYFWEFPEMRLFQEH
jgi:hypothetical protein